MLWSCRFSVEIWKEIERQIKTNKRLSLWDPSKGAPFDPRGPTLLLLTVVLLRVLRFFPTIPPPDGGMPQVIWQR